MIEFIKGDIVSVFENGVIVENCGLGYNIIMPTLSVGMLVGTNEDFPINDVIIYTHLYLRDDAISLYGFYSKIDRTIFRLLINVNKVGPKVAISIMSYLPTSHLIRAIMNDDAKIISQAQGIGIKTAQKVIIELKDKVKNIDITYLKGDTEIQYEEQMTLNNIQQDTISALIALGYSTNDAKRAVKSAIEAEDDDTNLIAKALRYL